MAVELGELLARGRTSDVFRYGNDAAIKVLRASTPQHWAQAEATFTASVRRLGVPVPDVRDLLDVDGRAAIVFERIDGPSMWQRMIERPGDVESLAADLVDVQRGIHAAGVPDEIPGLADRLGAKLEEAADLDPSERLAAVELLGSQPCGAALLHGDLHPGNVLLSANDMIVIDWFDATVGHPDADIARTLLLLRPTGATDLRHLPAGSAMTAERAHRCVADAVGSSPRINDWTRLQAAGRLSEGTDVDVSGLIALWQQSGND